MRSWTVDASPPTAIRNHHPTRPSTIPPGALHILTMLAPLAAAALLVIALHAARPVDALTCLSGYHCEGSFITAVFRDPWAM